MRDNYWTRHRTNRRRFLGTGAALGAGAAGLALVGCGGGDDDDGGTQLATPTTVAGTTPSPTPVDPFASAKRGGVYRVDSTGDPPTLDPYGNLSFLTKGYSDYVYSRLFKLGTGNDIPWGSVAPRPDLAAKAEPSTDGLTWVITLKDGVKFHNVAPVNGRALTSEDVIFSWNRLTAPTTQNRSQVAYVDKVEATDAKTVKFTLKEPRAPFLEDLADTNLLYIMPKEADGGFDPTQKGIGTGPWLFDVYQPSVKFSFKKNPEWHEKGFPLFDSVELAIIPEYANRKAQFLAGNTDSTGLSAEDLVEVKGAIKDVQFEARTGPTLSFFFFDGNDQNAIWVKDPRVRQAVSMAIDRDTLTEIGYNVKKLRDAGLAVETPWHNVIPAGETRWWLDPRDSSAAGMGAAAKYWKYDPAEAKKLLAAAGAEGLQMTYQYTANRYGKLFNDIAEAQFGMLTEVGFKLTTEVQDYSSKYITQTFAGNFKGLAFGYQTPFPEVGSYFIRMLTDDPLNHGKVNDPEIKALALRQAREIDPEKRKQTIHEIQRKHGEKMWYPPSQAGAGTGWSGHRGNLMNVGYATKGYGFPSEVAPYRWKA